jgi:hypothetical protein
MISVTSRRHWKNFYLALIGIVSFFLTMAVVTFALRDEAVSKFAEVIGILMSLLLFFMVFYSIVRYYQNVPSIYVDINSITFNRSETFFWKNVEKIELSGKFSFKFLGGNPKEGMMLKFFSGDKKYLFDDMYENSGEIKSFIHDFVIEKQPLETTPASEIKLPNKAEIALLDQGAIIEEKAFEVIPATESNPFDISKEKFVYYKGLQISSIDGLAMWLFVTPSLYVLVKASIELNGMAVAVLCFDLFLFLYIGRRLYYFGISDNYLVIKLHNAPWFKEIYYLSGIREVVFEQRFKMPVTLRVITNDFKSDVYPAGTVSDKQWMQLKDAFEKKNIKVRNDCNVSYKPFEFKFKLFD